MKKIIELYWKNAREIDIYLLNYYARYRDFIDFQKIQSLASINLPTNLIKEPLQDILRISKRKELFEEPMFQNFNEWNLPETIPDPGWDSLVPLRVHPDWYQEVEKKGAIKPNCDAISTNDEVDSVSELPDSVEEGEIDYNNEIESEEDQIISNNDL